MTRRQDALSASTTPVERALLLSMITQERCGNKVSHFRGIRKRRMQDRQMAGVPVMLEGAIAGRTLVTEIATETPAVVQGQRRKIACSTLWLLAGGWWRELKLTWIRCRRVLTGASEHCAPHSE